MSLQYMIVDDEPIAHEIIKNYAGMIPRLIFSHQCYDAINALEYLHGNPIDLIFLDLNMPKLKGLDFLRTLSNPPKVIITTAYREFAIEGYELDVVDYLLKPFSFERFVKAINKLPIENAPFNRKEASGNESHRKRLFISSNKKHYQIVLEDLLFVEAAGNYVKLSLRDKQIEIRSKLSSVAALLPESMFYRVHRSFIVSKQHISSIEGNLISIRDVKIPIGKMYRDSIGRLLA